jgi:hypothetical protein
MYVIMQGKNVKKDVNPHFELKNPLFYTMSYHLQPKTPQKQPQNWDESTI